MSLLRKKLLLAIGVLCCAAPLCAQQIALTFDDLPENGELPPHVTRLQIARSILATLKRERMPPIYGFVNAISFKDAPEEISFLKAWRAAGQPLGNHTYSHASLTADTVAQYETEIAKDEPVLKRFMGSQDWRWFRYPYLSEGETPEKRDAIRSYLDQKGYKIAQVSLDFKDYLWTDAYVRCAQQHNAKEMQAMEQGYLAAADQSITVFRQGTQALYGHEIPYVLLLHVGALDAKMLPRLIALLRQRGFTFVTLPEAMSDPAYKENPNVALADGVPFQEQVAIARHLTFPHIEDRAKYLDSVCPEH
ncbi:MAG: polysaccharide deacetylase family protein [Acidobacteria bacterium]|nr:polysaccharide deacetylase family protein [Acidobacteriota bacterium]